MTMKDLPILTERQLQDVISHDFPLYKAQYLEYEKTNPPKNNMRRRPKLPGRLDFDEFKFIVEAKFNYQSQQTMKEKKVSVHSPKGNIPVGKSVANRGRSAAAYQDAAEDYQDDEEDDSRQDGFEDSLNHRDENFDHNDEYTY